MSLNEAKKKIMFDLNVSEFDHVNSLLLPQTWESEFNCSINFLFLP